MLKQLLDGGANPNIQNRFRRTALSHHLENLENVKLLLQYDADPDIEDVMESDAGETLVMR